MTVSDLNPHIRYAVRRYNKIENKNQFSICYDCRFFFIENAEGFVIANGNKYNISNGSAIYFPPRTKYRFHFTKTEDFRIIVLNFDQTNAFSHLKNSLGTASEESFDEEKVPKYELSGELSVPIVKTLTRIAPTLIQCTEYFFLKESFYRESASALLKLCLIEMIRNNVQKGSYSELCKQVIDYIYENHARQELTNATIAEAFNYHPYHLNQIIKDVTGKSLHKHLTGTRLNFAKNFLLTTAYSVEEISWKTGFSSNSYFIKTFKESVGTTPKKYRQSRLITTL